MARCVAISAFALATTALLLAGCSSGPRMQDVAVPAQSGAAPEVQVQKDSRIADPREYRALLKAAAPEAKDRVMLDHLLAVAQSLTGSQLVAGNDARLLVDGPATFRAMFEDIDRAQTSIHLETFILEDDNIGQQLAEHLAAARARGVKVRLLYDAVGSLNTPDAFLDKLRKQGLDARKFHPVDPTEGGDLAKVNNRNHRKLMVVDGRVAYTGGINFAGVYSRASLSAAGGEGRADEAWRDTHVRITGPAVAQFQRAFLRLWNKDLAPEDAVGDAGLFPDIEPVGDMMIGALASNGGDGDKSDIYALISAAIGHAQQQLWITQAYFAPDQALVAALKSAAGRGVDVRLLLPGVSDSPWVVQASRASYEELLEAGVHIYERRGSTLHAKTVMVDGVWSTVGSANLDYRSFVYNNELNAVIVSKDFGRAMGKLFEVDLQQARQITLEAWRQRPLTQRAKELLGDFLRSWL